MYTQVISQLQWVVVEDSWFKKVRECGWDKLNNECIQMVWDKQSRYGTRRGANIENNKNSTSQVIKNYNIEGI